MHVRKVLISIVAVTILTGCDMLNPFNSGENITPMSLVSDNTLPSFKEGVAEGAPVVGDAIQNGSGVVSDAIKNNVNQVDNIPGLAPGLKQTIKDNVPAVADKIEQAGEIANQTIKDVAPDVADKIQEGADVVADKVKDELELETGYTQQTEKKPKTGEEADLPLEVSEPIKTEETQPDLPLGEPGPAVVQTPIVPPVSETEEPTTVPAIEVVDLDKDKDVTGELPKTGISDTITPTVCIVSIIILIVMKIAKKQRLY